MQNINFCQNLPKQPIWKISRKTFLQCLKGAMLVLIAILVLQGFWLGMKASYSLFLNHQIQSVKKDIQALILKRPELKGLLELSSEEARYTQIYEEKLALTDIISRHRSSDSFVLSSLLKGLSDAAIPGVWLTEIHTSRASHSLMLKGKTHGHTELNEFIRSLQANPRFKGFIVQTPSSSTALGTSKDLDFSLELTEEVP